MTAPGLVPAPANIHATALVCGDTGILLRGPSGSGKSALALRLIDRATRCGRFAALVADDRVLVGASGGRLVAAPPEPIRGLAELRGYGIIRVRAVQRAVVDIVADLGSVPRMPEPARVELAGADCRQLALPAADPAAALHILSVAVGLWPGGGVSF